MLPQWSRSVYGAWASPSPGGGGGGVHRDGGRGPLQGSPGSLAPVAAEGVQRVPLLHRRKLAAVCSWYLDRSQLHSRT